MTGAGLQRYRLGYRADLEGLRAIAILLVVAVHAGVPWLRGGFVGVDVFFVLSGFLITGLLVREITDTGGLRFAAFYVRRLRRLLPALFLMLAVVGVLALLWLAPAEQRGQSTAAAMAALWMSNIHFALAQLSYFAPGAKTNLFLHTWSLGVEEQFYLVWPALLAWLLAGGGVRGVARLKAGMLVVAAVSLVLCVWLTYVAPRIAFYMMPLRAWQFAAGALAWLYFMVPGGSPGWSPRLLHAAGWVGVALIAVAALALRATVAYPGGWALLPTLGAVAVIVAGCADGPSVGVSRWLAWGPLQWIGHISYSWYLWHWPILLLGRAVTGSDAPGWRAAWVALSLLVASGSYLFVESPTRHRRVWLARPRVTIFAALAVMALASTACLHWYARASARMATTEFKKYARARVDAPVIYRMGCDDWFHSARVRICAFGPADATHTAVLMGDSHAGQWFPAVAEAFDRPGWRVLVLTKSSCPMVDEPFFYQRIGRIYTVCSTWRAHALARVAEIKPDVVLLASDLAGFNQPQWVEGTTKVLNVLSPAVGQVYLLRDTPRLPFDGPGCLAGHSGRAHWLGLGHTCTAAVENRHADQVYRWMQSVSARFPNVSALDMNGLICPDGVCSAERDGVVVFRDSQHLTASFAASLGPQLAARTGGAEATATRR